MGLAIARKVLNATSGEIRIHGDEGQGAEFTIVLPGCSRCIDCNCTWSVVLMALE